MPTTNHDLPTPADGTLIADFPKTLRESNIKIDSVLKVQGDQVQQAKSDAQTAREAAVDAAGLVGTPPDSAISAAVAAPNSETRHNISAALDTAGNPALGALHAALSTATHQSVRIAAFGSSTTGAWDLAPSDKYFDRIITRMQMKYGVAYGAEKATVGGRTGAISETPGIQGFNFGDGGLTSRTFMGQERIDRVGLIQPAAIIMSIGANDAVYSYTPNEVKNNILQAMADLDAVCDIPPVYILIHQHELDSVNISSLWDQYRENMRAISIENPDRVAFIEASKPFRSIGIPGNDPYGFRRTDRVHLTEAGQHMLDEIIARGLGLADEKRTSKRILARDYFGRTENVELGRADSGQLWMNGDNWTVLDSGAATKYGGGTPILVMETPDVDARAVIKFTTGAAPYGGVTVRTLDTNNRLAVLCSAGTNDIISLYSVVGGVQTLRWSVPYNFDDGSEYTLCVAVKGREMIVYVNGAMVKYYTINAADYAALGQATGVGFHSSVHSAGMRYKRLRVIESN